MSEYVIHVKDAETLYEHTNFPFPLQAYLHEEIVRCRDCANASVYHSLNPITGVPAGIEYWRCNHFWNADELCEVEPDGFCAWGERRGDA